MKPLRELECAEYRRNAVHGSFRGAEFEGTSMSQSTRASGEMILAERKGNFVASEYSHGCLLQSIED